MKKSRFTEELIIGVLKQHESGMKTADLCWKHGLSGKTFHGWRAKYASMDVSEAQRLRAMKGENRRLKHFVGDLSLNKEALKALLPAPIEIGSVAVHEVFSLSCLPLRNV